MLSWWLIGSFSTGWALRFYRRSWQNRRRLSVGAALLDRCRWFCWRSSPSGRGVALGSLLAANFLDSECRICGLKNRIRALLRVNPFCGHKFLVLFILLLWVGWLAEPVLLSHGFLFFIGQELVSCCRKVRKRLQNGHCGSICAVKALGDEGASPAA